MIVCKSQRASVKHSLTTVFATFKVTGNLLSFSVWCSVWTAAGHFCYDFIPELLPCDWLISYLLSNNENILPNKVDTVCGSPGLLYTVEFSIAFNKQVLLAVLKNMGSFFFLLYMKNSKLNMKMFIVEVRTLLLAAMYVFQCPLSFFSAWRKHISF